jgi:hypothetical protein
MSFINSRSWNRFRSVAIRAGLAIAIASAMLLIPTATLADSNQTYNVTATMTSGSTLTGTVTVDFTTGKVTGAVTVDGLTFTCPGGGGCVYEGSVPGTQGFEMGNTPQTYVFINFNTLSPGPPPSSITLNSGYTFCNNCAGIKGYDKATSGIATAVATPEPPEALLLLAGLGALGMLMLFRKKSEANA